MIDLRNQDGVVEWGRTLSMTLPCCPNASARVCSVVWKARLLRCDHVRE